MEKSTCHTKISLDSNAFYEGFSDWVKHKSFPIRCLFSTAVNSITHIMVKVCSEDDGHQPDLLTLELENDDGERCKEEGLKVSTRQAFVSIIPRKCQHFKVTSTTKILASSSSGSGNFCLSHLYLDTVNKKTSKTRSQYCRFDQNNLVEDKLSIPLICA